MTRLSIVVGVGATVAIGLYAAARWFDLRGEVRYRISLRLDRKAEVPKRSALVLRSKFGDVPTLLIEKPQENHTHGVSAANRSSGSDTIELIARSLGSDVWWYQRSSSDVRQGREGSRTHYWSKDLNGPPARFEPQGSNTIIVMVDVDHYVDMNDFLARHFYPVLLYTCQPASVCRSVGEYSYTFDYGNLLDYSVSGGGGYKHKVWNYRGDSVKVTWGLWGLPMVTSVYQLERRWQSIDHQLILLAPLKRFWFENSILAEMFLEGDKLTRYSVVQGDFLRMEVKTPSQRLTITGKVNNYVCATVESSVDDTAASVARTTKSGLGLPAVRKVMGDVQDGAEILFEYHRNMNPKRILPTVNVVDDYVRTYQWWDDDYDPDVKPSMVSFMAPLVDGAFCPAMCKSNDRRAVDKRIAELRNDRPLNKHIVKLVEEFCERLWGGKIGMVDPMDEDYLKMKQNKPTQRRILDDAEFEAPDRRVKSFMKREAYQAINDPRIISTINGVDKRDYSLFMYSVAEILKEHEWYAFGKTPKQVATRVATVCENARNIVNTDFSRMDGRVSQVLRYLEERVMMTGFRVQYRDEILELMRTQHGLRGRTTHGVSYDSGLSRLSGSPETSAFNTIANAFVAYATYRAMSTGCKQWIGPDEAFARLGIYGGDDGVSADIDPKRYVSWADKVGQLLEVEPVKRGDTGVKFLSRQYGPYVWFGDPNSCCDFGRVMSKFHVTVTMNRNITPIDKLKDKAFALCLSDHDTPVVGPFVTRVMELAGDWCFTNLNQTWLPHGTDVDVQYPNEADGWMDSMFREQVLSFNCGEFLRWLANTQTLDDLLHVPQCAEKVEAVVKKDGSCVVDEDIISKLTITSPPEKSTERTKKTKEKVSTGKASKRKPSNKNGKLVVAKKTALAKT